MHDEGLWAQLSHDVNDVLQYNRGYVGYSDDDTTDDEEVDPTPAVDPTPVVDPTPAVDPAMPFLPMAAPGSYVALKADPVTKNTSRYTGYYQGAIAGILSLVAYSAFVMFNKKEEKVVATEEPFVIDEDEKFHFQIA